jgi:hypothetical protein
VLYVCSMMIWPAKSICVSVLLLSPSGWAIADVWASASKAAGDIVSCSELGNSDPRAGAGAHMCGRLLLAVTVVIMCC